MRWLSLLIAAVLLAGAAGVAPAETANVPLADGFEIPVGRNGKSYYKARGVRPKGHLGEDWNGVGGGDTDLGDPIYATANGIVVFAQDYRMGWGNVVIMRHAYLESGETKYVDSLYGHLLDFKVRVGELVRRGQLIARMGSNRGMYPAHLHFEMRKNINVGMYRNSFPHDWSIYWSPTEFVAAHRELSGSSRYVAVPINTFAKSPPPFVVSRKVATPERSVAAAGVSVVNGELVESVTTRRSPSSRTASASSSSAPPPGTPAPLLPNRRSTPVRRPEFRVNRFEDMRVLGYE